MKIYIQYSFIQANAKSVVALFVRPVIGGKQSINYQELEPFKHVDGFVGGYCVIGIVTEKSPYIDYVFLVPVYKYAWVARNNQKRKRSQITNNGNKDCIQGIVTEKSPFSDYVFLEAAYKFGWVDRTSRTYINKVNCVYVGGVGIYLLTMTISISFTFSTPDPDQ